MKTIYLYSLLLLSLFAFTACQNEETAKEKSPSDISKDLNDAAMQIQLKARDTNDLIQSLYFLDQAIQADSLNLMAYSNKINVLLELKKEDKALQTLQLINTRKPTAEFVMFEGFLYDKGKDSLKAEEQYHKALNLYDAQFQETKDSSLLLNKGFAILFIYGQDSGYNYYMKQKDAFQHIPLYEQMLEQAKEFNKAQFLQDLF